MAKLPDRISIEPTICGGKPCIRGTRIWVSLILDLLDRGMDEEEVCAKYPQLTLDDVLAAIDYGAKASRERAGAARTAPAVSDPLDSFDEWRSDEDERLYRDL